MSRKEELERLKKELLDREKEEKLQSEIDTIRRRLEGDKPTGQGLKAWLKARNLWRSFVLIVVGIVSAEAGAFTGFYPAYGVGALMIILGVFLVPYVREFFGDLFK